MENKTKIEQQLLREIEDLWRKLEVAEDGRKESDKTLQVQIASQGFGKETILWVL